MFRIVRFPSKLQSFFDPLSDQFHFHHFQYFQTLVLLMVFAWGRRNITTLYRHLDSRSHPHRSRFNNFLNVGRWNPAAVLQLKANELLTLLGPQPGETVEFVLDDSKKQKRGKAMEAVSWIYDPTTGRKIWGHQYVVATIRFRGHTIPFGTRFYLKKEDCPALGRPFRKTTQLAADLIGQFTPPPGIKVRVLFDSYYLCPTVVKACRRKDFRWVSTLKNNCNLFKHGRKLKTGSYGKSLLSRSNKKIYWINKTDGQTRYTYTDAGWLNVSGVGRAHVIFSRKNTESRILGIATDEPMLSAGQIIHAYHDRWSIEVFFKDGKQLLGLGQYQNLLLEAAVTHLHLVCFAYALLTHIAISREGAQGKRKPATRLSTAGLQNEVRRIVWDDLTRYLNQCSSGDQIVKELQRLLIAA